MKKGLGKGLGALLPDISKINDNQEDKDEVVELKITEIEPNPDQPRKFFDDSKLEDLCASIKEHGVIQPIIVRKADMGFYSIIAGERRWRAAKLAGLTAMPVIIREYDDIKTRQVALIENLQRENLNAIEEAKGYRDLAQQFGLTQDEISKKVSKSRPAVANALRLLNLPDVVIKQIEDEQLSSGQARAILGIEDKGQQIEVANKVVEEGLNVRQVERLVSDIKSGKVKTERSEPKEEAKSQAEIELLSIENNLSQVIGSKVRIISGKNKGKLEIEYYSEEELERIIKYLESFK